LQKADIFFGEKVKGRWRGRTPTNKIVFVESEDDPSTGSGQSLRGKIIPVTVTWTGPWSMQAALMKQSELISL
jgi:tRNA-2-methylthio-N6-dimethylallyladenosine synthase